MSDKDTDETKKCNGCDEKSLELQEVRERHRKQLDETKKWYESETETLRQDLLLQVEEKDKEISNYKKEISTLTHTTIPSCSTSSIVARGIADIFCGPGDTQNTASPTCTLDDSSLVEDIQDQEIEHEKECGQPSQKRSACSSNSNKDVCSLCNKKKRLAMIKCVSCDQWIHCSCLMKTYTEAKEIAATFKCKDCN